MAIASLPTSSSPRSWRKCITTMSLHPGAVNTSIMGKANGVQSWLLFLFNPLIWAFGLTEEEGAKNQLWCATAATGTADGEVENGAFYVPIGKKKEDNKHANDPALVEELWRWTNDELAKHGGPGWPEA